MVTGWHCCLLRQNERQCYLKRGMGITLLLENGMSMTVLSERWDDDDIATLNMV
jgi:hypothetical protein